MKISVGIVGFGFMGHVLAQQLMSRSDYDLRAVCDINPKQLEDAPDSINVYSSVEEMVVNEDIELVIIAANNNQHLDLVKFAAENKINILCEKPVALTLQELDEMIEVTKANGVKFTVHQQRRFDRDFRTVKNVYDSQSLGDIYTIQSKLYGFNGNMHDWHVIPEEGGGMLYDWGVHLIDQVLWMVPDDIKTIYADIRNVINKEVDDYFKILIRFANDTIAEIELGTYFLADKENWFERHWFVGGNKGSMYSDGFDPKGKIVRTTKLLENVEGKPTMTAAGPTRSFGPPSEGILVTEDLPIADTNHMQYFDFLYQWLVNDDEGLVKVPEVRRVLRVMDAVRESGRTGQAVRFIEEERYSDQ